MEVAAQRGLAAAKDSSFLGRYAVAAVAQPLAVIEANVGYHGNIRIDQIDRIQAPAQPDLQHRGIQAGLLKEPESRKRPHFEIGQGYIATSRLDGSEGSTKRFIAGLLTIDLHALVVAQQMWRAVYTHLQPLPAQQGSDESTGGALAVGTRDGNDAPRRTPETEPDGHLPRTLQPHVDGSRMQLFEVGEPVAQAPAGHALAVTSAGSTGEGSCCSCASRRARRGRSSARGMIRSIAPWSSRNSLRWKPSGSFSRTVCSITRGPAKPMSALGSATITSPSIAKLADTPP